LGRSEVVISYLGDEHMSFVPPCVD
jgi:hypothetical protein